MGRQIIKIALDRDLYLDWSSIVEAPLFIGGRADLLAYLVSDYREGTDRYAREAERAEERVVLADDAGSSWPLGFGCTWDGKGEIYQQRGFLPRARFGEFAERWLASPDDVEPDVSDLLEPFEDR